MTPRTTKLLSRITYHPWVTVPAAVAFTAIVTVEMVRYCGREIPTTARVPDVSACDPAD